MNSLKNLCCLGLVFFFAAHAFAGSMLGLEALGTEDLHGATAATAGRGYAGGAKTGNGLSLLNPSVLAFEENVSFSATAYYEMTSAEKGDDVYVSNTLTIPSLYLAFPLGNLGAFAVGLSQRYYSELDMESEDAAKTQNVKLEYSGSVLEFIPTYAIRLPFFRRVSLGATMHIVTGSTERSLKLGPDNSQISKEDSWATNEATVTEVADGEWDTESIAYYTLSAMYRGRSSNIYFSVSTPYTLVNDITYDFQFSKIDTLAGFETERKIKVPLALAAGIDFRLYENHHLLFDIMTKKWDDSIENIAGSWDIAEKTDVQSELFLALGYQKDGSALFYDSYLARMEFRAGVWYRDLYIKDVSEFGAALGLGLPLGSRGTMVDIALQGGIRNAEDSNWDESFFGIRVTLMGVGSWGKKSR